MEASPSGLRCVRAPVNRSHRPSGGPNDGGTVQWYTILQEPRDWQSDSLTGGHLHKCPATAAAHPGTLPVHGPAARDRLGWSRRTGVGWLVDPRARHRARPARRPCSTTRGFARGTTTYTWQDHNEDQQGVPREPGRRTFTLADSRVLLGDPRQLDQPIQEVHPPGADVSALGHLLGESVDRRRVARASASTRRGLNGLSRSDWRERVRAAAAASVGIPPPPRRRDRRAVRARQPSGPAARTAGPRERLLEFASSRKSSYNPSSRAGRGAS